MLVDYLPLWNFLRICRSSSPFNGTPPRQGAQVWLASSLIAADPFCYCGGFMSTWLTGHSHALGAAPVLKILSRRLPAHQLSAADAGPAREHG
jgi:hypothetical protein